METNKIYQGDCLELMKQIEDKSIDLILCDLPYGTTSNNWDCEIDLEGLWKAYERIIKDNGAIVLTATQPFASKLVMSNLKLFKYEWIWNKHRPSNIFLAKKQPMRNHEQILVFYNSQPKYNPIPRLKNTGKMFSNKQQVKQSVNPRTTGSFGDTPLKFNDNSDKYGYPMTIIDELPMENNLNTPKDELGLHPTQKALNLFEYLIRSYTDEGDVVLDNCIGSGTTAIGCIKTNRRFIGIELSEEYCKVANERIQKKLSQTKLTTELGIPPKPKDLGILPTII